VEIDDVPHADIEGIFSLIGPQPATRW